MAGKLPYEILVYHDTIWVSHIRYSWETGKQRWRVYERPRNHPWWEGGCILKGDTPLLWNTYVPKDFLLQAYAWSAWPWETDLWFPSGWPNEYHIWYTRQNWEEFLQAGLKNWVCVGKDFYDPPGDTDPTGALGRI